MNLSKQFLRYCLAGGIAYVIDFLTLYVLATYLRLHYLAAATAGFCLGIAAVYLLSIFWIFETRIVADRRHEFAIFLLIGIAGLGINNLTMYLLTNGLGLYFMASKLAAAGLVLTFNFSARRHFLFQERNSLK